MDAVEPSAGDLVAPHIPDQVPLAAVQRDETAEIMVDEELPRRFALRNAASDAGALTQAREEQLAQRGSVELGRSPEPLESREVIQCFAWREAIRYAKPSGVLGEIFHDRVGTHRRETQSLAGKDIDVNVLRKARIQVAVWRPQQEQQLPYPLVLVLKGQRKGVLLPCQDVICICVRLGQRLNPV